MTQTTTDAAQLARQLADRRCGAVRPRLSVGCAVYRSDPDGLTRALESVLAQTFDDFELVICDHSPDTATRDVIEPIARRDERVSYFYNDLNIGAYPSFWRAMQLGAGPYFKWVADDDVLAPTYFQQCVDALDADETIALCYPRTTVRWGDTGEEEVGAGGEIEAMDESPVERFKQVLAQRWAAHGFYGVMRSSVLRRLHPLSHDCCRLADVLLMAEVALYGRIRLLDDVLFEYTEKRQPWDDRETLNANHYRICFPNNPTRGITLPNVKFAAELFEAVRHSDLEPVDKAELYHVIPQIVRAKLGGYWQQEIDRAIALVGQNMFLHGWGDAAERHPKIVDSHRGVVYRFHASEMLRRFEEVLLVWPDYPSPGLHSARAICMVLMNRIPEAVATLRLEQHLHPDFAVARELLTKLGQTP